MKNLKIILCMAFAIGFSQVISAQSGLGKIMGKVTDSETNETVVGALAYVEYGEQKIASRTDIDGRFTLGPLKPGTYILTISMGEKKIQIPDVQVRSDQITFRNEIAFNPVNMTEEVLIVEYREPLINPEEASRMNLSAAMIKNSPNLRDATKLVESMGSGITRDSEGQLYFRGARPQSTVTFVDGVKTGSTVSQLPGRAIGNITVYTGGVPAKYGDCTGGVIIMETKSYFDLYYERKAQEKR